MRRTMIAALCAAAAFAVPVADASATGYFAAA